MGMGAGRGASSGGLPLSLPRAADGRLNPRRPPARSLTPTPQGSYRAKQLQDAVLGGARAIADVTTLSKEFRGALADRGVRTGRSLLHHEVRAADGTRKFLLQLFDGRVVETVGIPVDDTGVGCGGWGVGGGGGVGIGVGGLRGDMVDRQQASLWGVQVGCFSHCFVGVGWAWRGGSAAAAG